MEGWIETKLEHGDPIPEPAGDDQFSGKFNVRIPKSLHRRLAAEAQQEGVSLNQYVLYKLSSSPSAKEVKTFVYVTHDGNILKDDQEFEYHYRLDTPVSVEAIQGDKVLTTGLIEKYDEKTVVINGHVYDRISHLFISRPHHTTAK